ncbi:MAG: ATP synthase F1 subunit gamma [Erysipelotrichia bacterium]|nr:ATP synthase F1 subunit gamma [Erysipelotrichia bacterium]
MASLRDIRQKVKGVATTQQITGAMKMMSTARLGKAMEAINLTQAYISKLTQMVQNIKRALPDYQHHCLTAREVKKNCLIIIGGERGLCGGFNHELNRFALKTVREYNPATTKIIVIGRKAVRYLEHKEVHIDSAFPDLNLKSIDTELFDVSEQIFALYKNQEVDEINIVYTSFASPVKKYLTMTRLLPVDTSSLLPEKKGKNQPCFDFNPSPDALFDELMPRYLRNLLYRAILESSAAEQSARMTAMTSATDRAEEIIEDLKLDLNRGRQALITREISEVIAGSQA